MRRNPELRMPIGNEPQGSGAGPNIRSWRPREAREVQREREKVEGDITDEVRDLETEIARLSAKGRLSSEESGQLAAARNELARLLRPMALFAYGGNAYDGRRNFGGWPEIPMGACQDLYGLRDDKLTFGVGELRERNFLIFRQLQNKANRGGIPILCFLTRAKLFGEWPSGTPRQSSRKF